jgi:hypothetical protein
MVAAGLALSGCIDVECPAEFARPTARERYCGHSGYVAAPTPYRQNYAPLPPQPRAAAAVVNPILGPQPLPSAAPVGPPVVVEPMPPAPTLR